MLTKYDEFLCHQIVSTFDHIETSDRMWTERTWFSAHDTSGKLHLVTSIGYYPNRNVMDAYGSVAVDGKTQYTVRASRELHPDIDTKVGPFSYQVIEPLRRLRAALAENEHGLSFDVEFEATMPPHEQEQAPQFIRSRGRVIQNVNRYFQVGKPSGWIKVEGQTYQIDKNSWLAERDHSWGIRRTGAESETGVQPGEIPPGFCFQFSLMQFPEWGVFFEQPEDWEGKPFHSSGAVFYPYGSGKEELKLVNIEHDYQFRPDIRQLTSGRLVLTAIDGSKIELSVHPLSVVYMMPGGYFGYKGFTHGLWMGPYYIDGLKLDLTDPNVEREISFFDDRMCEMRCGDDVGYGIIELVVTGKYPRYGYQGY